MKITGMILIALGLILTTWFGIVSIDKNNQEFRDTYNKVPLLINPIIGIIITGFGIAIMATVRRNKKINRFEKDTNNYNGN